MQLHHRLQTDWTKPLLTSQAESEQRTDHAEPSLGIHITVWGAAAASTGYVHKTECFLLMHVILVGVKCDVVFPRRNVRT